MSEEMKRREFLASTGRWLGLAALGGWLGRVALRPGDGAGRDRVALCARCPSLRSCSLRDGVLAREALGRSGEGQPRGGAKDAPLCRAGRRTVRQGGGKNRGEPWLRKKRLMAV